MKKIIKSLVNKLLKSQGVTIARIHEIDFLDQKYDALIGETEGFFSELLFNKLPANQKRIKLMARLNGTQISEAFYLLNYLHKSLKLEGDICEFGIANGATSVLIANEIYGTDKSLWLFDSFQGLSKPTREDKLLDDIFHLGSMQRYEGSMSYGEQEVINKLHAIDFPDSKVNIVSGFIEESIKQKGLPKKVAFAYIDFDLYSPTQVALKFLDKVLVKGGHIIVDDYGYFSEGVKIAVDQFLKHAQGKYSLKLPHQFAGHFCMIQKM